MDDDPKDTGERKVWREGELGTGAGKRTRKIGRIGIRKLTEAITY